MDSELFKRLLYEDESVTLDFKQAQYPFVKATKDEKSELLKDILGFANAWRRSEAYIIIGVEEVRGGRGNVVGISADAHLHDHALQQFVSSRTNRPVRFSYEAFEFEGKHVGIITIEEQTRPFCLKRDYGKLKKSDVYVRRGSSIDPTKPASVDEIVQMGLGLAPVAAELHVEFADVERDAALGTEISLESEWCEMPDAEAIPRLSRPSQKLPFGLSAHVYGDLTNPLNIAFFHELANFEFAHRLLRPISVAVKNIGKVAANDVRVELTVPMNSGAFVMHADELPDPPKRRGSSPGVFRHTRRPGDVTIDKNDDRVQIEMDYEDLQPGRRVCSEVFYIGTGESGAVSLHGVVFAANLGQPKDFVLTANISVKRTQMSVEELRSLPEPDARAF